MDFDLIIVILIIIIAVVIAIGLKVLIVLFAKKGIDKISKKDNKKIKK